MRSEPMSDAELQNAKRPDKDNLPPTADFGAGVLTPGGQIGPYKLLSILGEGGFAVVYQSEQQEPVKRRVALKVIKPGMDTKQVIARFEAERQALALLDHPNIARVFDAGTTDTGRPYFVMEYVKGVPITEHCDRHKLNIQERLGLLLQVCEAIQHAHQKGIIHRDIKPSNILVSIEGEHAVPKVIDFGVAKAITQPLTERTLFTEQGQLIGTPEYMSPEQAEISAQDIDIRSDIYSVGVLLYELLTGVLPFDREMLKGASFSEIQRIIQQEVPPRPSTRLTVLGEEVKTVVENRRTDVGTLARCLRRELEWIPLKAMRKERSRRYRSASELADDIRNYLKGAPLIAGPESTVYRVRKFVLRNRALVTSVLTVLVVLIAGIFVSTVFAIKEAQSRGEAMAARDEAERQAKISQAVSDFLREDLLASVDPYVAQGREVTVRSFLDAASEKLEGKFEHEPLVEASIRHTLGNTYRNIGDFDAAEIHLQRAYQMRLEQLGEEHQDTLSTMEGLAMVYWRQGRYNEAELLFTKNVESRRRVLGDQHADTLYSMNGLAVLYFSQGRYPDAESLYEKVLEISRSLFGEDDVSTLLFMGNLATVYRFQGRYKEAESLYLKAIENESRVLGQEHPDTLYSINGLAMLYIAQERYSEAEPLLDNALEIGYLVLGEEHPDTLYSMNGLAMLYTAQGRYDEAEGLLARTLEIGRLTLGEEHPSTLASMNCLAWLYRQKGRYEDSEMMYVNALEGRRRILGEEHPDTLESMNGLAVIYTALERYDEAEKLFIKTFQNRLHILGEKHQDTLDSVKGLIELYEAWDKPQEAQQWRTKLPDAESSRK